MADPKPDIVKSPIIMKVDGPAEDNQDNEENERIEELIVCSPAPVLRKPILSSSKLGNPFGVNNFKPLSGGSILKAPVLGAVSAPKAPFTLNPSKLSFGGSVGTSNDSGDASGLGALKGSVTSSSGGGSSNSNGASTSNFVQAPRFVPLLADTTTGKIEGCGKAIISTSTPSSTGAPIHNTNNINTSSTSSRTSASTSGFVFGQNLKERVIGDPHISTSSQPTSSSPQSTITSSKQPSSSTTSTTVVVSSSNGIAGPSGMGDSPSPPTTHEQHNAVATTSKIESAQTDLGEGCSTSGNSGSGSLFSTVIREREQEQREGATMAADVSSTSGKSLSESAREWEEQRANKRKYEEVEVRTGEEGETNVAQVSCKLFAWCGGSWAERGRGILRLNDREVVDDATGACYPQSRLVFRTSGSLRVILNTKIWSGMEVKEASSKSLMLTAVDGAARLYLLNAAQDDVRLLYRLVTARVRVDSLRTQGSNSSSNATPSSSEVANVTAAEVDSDSTTAAVAASSGESAELATKTDVCTSSSSQDAEDHTEEAE